MGIVRACARVSLCVRACVCVCVCAIYMHGVCVLCACACNVCARVIACAHVFPSGEGGWGKPRRGWLRPPCVPAACAIRDVMACGERTMMRDAGCVAQAAG